MDIADVFVFGDCFNDLPTSLEKLKLGQPTKEEHLIKLSKYKNLKSLCLKRSQTKWTWLKPEILPNLLKLCVNDQFAEEDIKSLPQNLRELDLTQCPDERRVRITCADPITGQNFIYLPKSLIILRFLSLKKIKKEYLESSLPANLSEVYIEDCEDETLDNRKHQEKVKTLKENGIEVLDQESKCEYPNNKQELEIRGRKEMERILSGNNN